MPTACLSLALLFRLAEKGLHGFREEATGLQPAHSVREGRVAFDFRIDALRMEQNIRGSEFYFRRTQLRDVAVEQVSALPADMPAVFLRDSNQLTLSPCDEIQVIEHFRATSFLFVTVTEKEVHTQVLHKA